MKKYVQIVSVLLCATLLFAGIAPNFTTSKTTPIVRSMEISASEMDNQSALMAFDSYEVNLLEEEGKANFVGYKEIPLSDLYDLDLIADANTDATAQTRFSCTYDYENGIVILSALLESVEETIILDEIYGLIFMNENEEFDVAFAIEDDIFLLSEMKEAGLINECGLFSKVGSALKKVWNTTSGKIGTIATVAACAVVGTVCAIVPGGQLVTAVCIGVAVGAVGGAITAAVATYEADGVIDWEAVGIYTGVMAVVGGAVSATSYGITTAIKHVVKSGKTLADVVKQKNIPKTKFETSQLQHEFKHAKDLGIKGNWNTANGNLFKEAINANIESSTNLFKSFFRGTQEVYVYYNSATNVGVYVDMAGNFVGAWALTPEQLAFHMAQLILF